MSEQSLWKNLRKKMVPEFWPEATRHEDKLQGGIADVSFVQFHRHGWMELKHMELAPVRETTIVRVKFQPEQKPWLQKKGEAAGGTFLLLQLERDYLLFDWFNAVRYVGTVNRIDLYDIACYVSKGKLDPIGLKSAIGDNW